MEEIVPFEVWLKLLGTTGVCEVFKLLSAIQHLKRAIGSMSRVAARQETASVIKKKKIRRGSFLVIARLSRAKNEPFVPFVFSGVFPKKISGWVFRVGCVLIWAGQVAESFTGSKKLQAKSGGKKRTKKRAIREYDKTVDGEFHGIPGPPSRVFLGIFLALSVR